MTEALQAHATLERFLFGVRSHMTFQVVVPREILAALLADERFDFLVNIFHVPEQAAAEIELFHADVTFVAQEKLLRV